MLRKCTDCKHEQDNQRASQELQEYMRNLRNHTRIDGINSPKPNTQIISTDERVGFIGFRAVRRLVVFLKGTGCTHAKKDGGCTFCGFYNATNFGEKLKDTDYLSQIDNLICERDLSVYECVSLYNDGSMLCEDEISVEVISKILQKFNEFHNIQKITIEAKIEDISEANTYLLRHSFSREIEIAVGFESASSQIRRLCVNKNFSAHQFEKVVKITTDNSISLVPLLMMKPPFLTEKESIDDFNNSLSYLENFNLNRIDVELPTVEQNTLTEMMWNLGAYKPVSLWSLFEVLREKSRKSLKTRLYISPMIYSVSSIAQADSCDKCFSRLLGKIQKYNLDQDSSIFDDEDCECKLMWDNGILEINLMPLHERVEKMLATLNKIR